MDTKNYILVCRVCDFESEILIKEASDLLGHKCSNCGHEITCFDGLPILKRKDK